MLEAEARGGRAADPILIVEGADLLRRILIQDVEEMGYRVEAVASGAAALAALESASFRVALVDATISEPDARGLSGWAAARDASTRFILLVPFTGGEGLAQEPGLFFGSLKMPFAQGDLQALIENALEDDPAQATAGSTNA